MAVVNDHDANEWFHERRKTSVFLRTMELLVRFLPNKNDPRDGLRGSHVDKTYSARGARQCLLCISRREVLLHPARPPRVQSVIRFCQQQKNIVSVWTSPLAKYTSVRWRRQLYIIGTKHSPACASMTVTVRCEVIIHGRTASFVRAATGASWCLDVYALCTEMPDGDQDESTPQLVCLPTPTFPSRKIPQVAACLTSSTWTRQIAYGWRLPASVGCWFLNEIWLAINRLAYNQFLTR